MLMCFIHQFGPFQHVMILPWSRMTFIIIDQPYLDHLNFLLPSLPLCPRYGYLPKH